MAPFLQSSRSASSADRPAASSHPQAFLFSLSRNATRFNQDDQQRPAMPERPLRATRPTPSVGPRSSECPTSRAWVQRLQRRGASLLIRRSIQITATTSLRRSIHIDSDKGRPEAGQFSGPQQDPACPSSDLHTLKKLKKQSSSGHSEIKETVYFGD